MMKSRFEYTSSIIFLGLIVIFFISCEENYAKKINKKMNSGKIIYRTQLIPNPDWRQKGKVLYSQNFIQQSTTTNTGKTTELTFKGNQTMIKGKDNQYGFFSPYVQIHLGEEEEIYCKEFHKLKWYIKYPLAVPIQDKEQLIVTFLPEEKMIAGYRCKKARLQGLNTSTDVYYTDEIEVSLPNHLWLKNNSIPGVILKKNN